MKTIIENLAELREEGNLRSIRMDSSCNDSTDLSTNDYLGLNDRADLREEFMNLYPVGKLAMSASASRLLASSQKPFSTFEATLEKYYPGKKALIFNSGYHANTGLVSALGTKGTHIIADKLVHASIIDGIKLSNATFERFRHNDISHLDRILAKSAASSQRNIIIVESVYSMDGDKADIEALVEIKERYPNTILYVDEAHAVGVEGPGGLGVCMASGKADKVDIIVGTLGKALCSCGAFAITSPEIREYAVNKSRSFIFSTALPPINIMWSDYIFRKALEMDTEREQLYALGRLLGEALEAAGGNISFSHIQPLIIGNPKDAKEFSERLAKENFTVLPIRTPTVPPGTDRLRFSLSASINPKELVRLKNVLSNLTIHE